MADEKQPRAVAKRIGDARADHGGERRRNADRRAKTRPRCRDRERGEKQQCARIGARPDRNANREDRVSGERDPVAPGARYVEGALVHENVISLGKSTLGRWRVRNKAPARANEWKVEPGRRASQN